MPRYSYEIGTSGSDTINLEELGINPPKHTYTKYPRKTDLVSLRQRGHGTPITTWTWGYLTATERETLRTYCPGKSSLVRIKTKDEQSTYKVYEAIMIWPDKDSPEERDVCLNFTLTFKHILEVA